MTGSFVARSTTVLIVALSLAGCATNAIRLDRAETMVEAGRTAGTATTSLLEQTRAANREVLLDLVAIDPECSLRRPVIASPTDKRVKQFCRRGAIPGEDGAFEIERIVLSDFKPTLAVVAGLAGYLDQVEAVLSRDPIDIGADLAAAESDLRVLLGAAQAVAGDGTPLPTLNDAQKTALGGALELLSTLADEQSRVDDLRTIESRENREAFARTLSGLHAANTLWLKKYAGQLANRETLLATQLSKLSKATPEKRRPVAAALLKAIEEREALPKLRAALFEVANALGASHDAYLELLDDGNAPLTDEERRRKAQLNHDRVIGALKSLTALITVF